MLVNINNPGLENRVGSFKTIWKNILNTDNVET